MWRWRSERGLSCGRDEAFTNCPRSDDSVSGQRQIRFVTGERNRKALVMDEFHAGPLPSVHWPQYTLNHCPRAIEGQGT